MKHTTLLFLLKDKHILLAMKKRGFGVGRWNGVGGKIQEGESVEEAAVRECREEIGVLPGLLERVGHLTFTFPDGTPDWLTHVFVVRDWQGEPKESEEMAPRWFVHEDIPYDTMWQDDIFWLPHVLQGKKVRATFSFDEQENLLQQGSEINLVDQLDAI